MWSADLATNSIARGAGRPASSARAHLARALARRRPRDPFAMLAPERGEEEIVVARLGRGRLRRDRAKRGVEPVQRLRHVAPAALDEHALPDLRMELRDALGERDEAERLGRDGWLRTWLGRLRRRHPHEPARQPGT